MIDKDDGVYVPICDICGDTLQGEDTYDDAVHAKKEAGWKMVYYKGEKQDACTVCQNR